MKEKMVWKRAYTLVILLNVLYILFFYYVMISNA